MENRRVFFEKIGYYCFYIAVIIEVLIVLVDKSDYINPVEGRLFQLTFLLFLIKVCVTRYTWKEYLAIFLFCVLGSVSYFVTERNEILRFIIFVAACKDIDMKKCLKLVFFMTLAGCVVIMLLSVTGIYGVLSLTQDYGRGATETRYVLGMGHPNSLQCMIWALTVLGLYLYGERMQWYGYLSLMAVNIFFFCLTDSKTSLIVAAFAIAYTGIICLIKSDVFRKVCCICGGIFVLGGISISILIAAEAYQVYNYYWSLGNTGFTEFFVWLDRILTGRIHSLVGTTRWEGTIRTWSLFSTPVNNYYFDMGWIRLFYWYGIIPAGIFILLLFGLMFYCMKKKDYMAFVMLVAFAIYSVVEAHAISVYLARNYVIFLLGGYWYRMLIREKDHVKEIREL